MTISVALLGAGIGAQHFAAYQKLRPDFDVSWIIDQQTERAHALNVDKRARVSASIEEALADPQVDLVDICLPPHLHVPVCLQALENRKHVICEKPLATSLLEVDEIELAAQRSGKSVFPVFQYRWGPSLAQLRHLIAKGIAGRPHVASLETHWSRGAEYYAVDWRGTWVGEQGGAILGHAIHNHDLMTHVMGPVRAVSAATATRINAIETEDCAAIAFELENGALVTSSVTLGAATDETRLRFVFENLTATSGSAPYAPGTVPWTFTARDPANQHRVEEAIRNAPEEPAGFEGFLAAIARHLDDPGTPVVTLQDGAASIALVTAIYHAARTGDRVCLPLTTDHPLYRGWQP